MRLVLDQIFCDTLAFFLPIAEARRCRNTAGTMGEAFGAACALVGLELIDYDSQRFTDYPTSGTTLVEGHSRAWRERMQR